MDHFLQSLFGPLSKDYCLYFYILSMVGFFLLVLLCITTLMVGISQRQGIGFYLQMLTGGIAYAIFYFQNRLLHSMCVGSA
jgi:hypothetical protein